MDIDSNEDNLNELDNLGEFSYNFRDTSVSVKGPNLSKCSNNNNINAKQTYSNFNLPKNTMFLHGQRRNNKPMRQISPKKTYSVCDFQTRNFNFPNYPQSLQDQSCSQSGFNFRCRCLSEDTAYITSTEIVEALQTQRYNKTDIKILKRAFTKFLNKNKDYDSGEQGSDSSLSNDEDRDNRSTRYSTAKRSVSSIQSKKAYSTNTRVSRCHRALKCANFKQNPIHNTQLLISSNLSNKSEVVREIPQPVLKDRFTESYLLPSQRFNRPIATTSIAEDISNVQSYDIVNINSGTNNNLTQTEQHSTQQNTTENNLEDTLLQVTVEGNINGSQSSKRKYEELENPAIKCKKKRKLSPIKKSFDINVNPITNSKNIENDETDDFLFAKPSFPIKKLSKPKIKETPLSNSILPLNDTPPTPTLSKLPDVAEFVNESVCKSSEHSATNLPNRPSLSKRKLFTQNLDVAENKIISNDNVNSPINIHNQKQKKNKTRKLVSNQSCLNRDVSQDTDVTDLIHKIVSLSQIDSMNASCKPIDRNKDVGDKWDVSAVIISCENDNESDTFTDEDIFQQNVTDDINGKNNSRGNGNTCNILKDCQVLLEKALPSNTKSNISSTTKHENGKGSTLNKENIPDTKVDASKSKVIISTFWDTDIESDIECVGMNKNVPKLPQKDNGTETQLKEQKTNAEELSNRVCSNNKNTLTTHAYDEKSKDCSTFNGQRLNLSVRSNRVPNKRLQCTQKKNPTKNVAALADKCKPQYQKNNCTKAKTNINAKIENTEIKGHENVSTIKTSHNAKEGNISGTNDRVNKIVSKTPSVRTRAKKPTNSNYNKSSSVTIDQLTKTNINTKSITGRTVQKRVSNKIRNLTVIESDVSFTLLDMSVTTRSMTKAKSKNNLCANVQKSLGKERSNTKTMTKT